MTDRVNQHYVPQFYFRHFSEDGRTIGTILLDDGQLIPHAPIKGQCSRRNFYGSKELEAIFSHMEGEHCHSIRAALDIANNADAEFFTPAELMGLFQAIVFQRSRTALEIEKHAPAMETFALESFKHYLMCKEGIENRDEMIRQIDIGNVRVTEPPQATIARQIANCIDASILITDLKLLLLRNRTDFPFIFGDAPVVFYNNYCRNVKNRGVLGLQCPGLQIFFPLNSTTCLLLLDADKYGGPHDGFIHHDVYQRSDVSQINALQLHHALNTAYFGCLAEQKYVHDLWNTHRATITRPTGECRVGVDFLVDGKKPEGELMQLMENQVNFELNLSFIECDPIAEHEYVFRPRSPELRDEYKSRMNENVGT